MMPNKLDQPDDVLTPAMVVFLLVLALSVLTTTCSLWRG